MANQKENASSTPAGTSSAQSGSSSSPNSQPQGVSRETGGGQQMSRSSQSGGIAQAGRMQPYFPSPGEFFSNPFAAMRRMHEDMDRMFSQALGGGMMTGSAGAGSSGGGMTAWSPAIEVKQQGNDLVVCAELPGLKPEDVHVELEQDALIIHGERRQEESSNQGGVHRTERRYGQFYRAIPLPEGVNAEQAKAEFNHGVLEVKIPLPQQQQPQRRQIPISGAGSGSSQSGSTSQQTTGTGTQQSGAQS